MDTLSILMVGDIVGSSGRAVFDRHIDTLKKDYKIDFVIVNGENSAHGVGITPRIADSFLKSGVDVITSGNHIWHKKEIYQYLATHSELLRPANYPSGVPGFGHTLIHKFGVTYAVINVMGRVFMREDLDCPFKTTETLLMYLKDKTPLIFIDIHAEATSEKQAFATYFDGKVTAVFGTHTHVPTADERVLPSGTAYITDVGMAGAVNSLLGMEGRPVIQRFLTQMPVKFTVEMKPPYVLNAVLVKADKISGKAQSIERIAIYDNTQAIDTDDNK